MNMETVYLVCFGVGLALSLVFALTGAMHIHLPGKAFAHGHVHVHVHHGAHASRVGARSDVSPFNLFSAMAFLAWFGGAGYLLTRYSSFVGLTALLLAMLSGVAGAAIVFWFFAKVMLTKERVLEDADFEMVGVIGHVSSSVFPNGSGEVIFEQNGRRKGVCARSESGAQIERGTEVVVTRYERGVAYVRPWTEFAEENKLEARG
jgi:membrane protein implicated in regulation of membrane protease activity